MIFIIVFFLLYIFMAFVNYNLYSHFEAFDNDDEMWPVMSIFWVITDLVYFINFVIIIPFKKGSIYLSDLIIGLIRNK